MRVFKNYFKIAMAHKVSIILYTLIFLAILSFSTKSDKNDFYTDVRPNIYLKDEAKTDLSEGLYDYLDNKAVIKKMDESLVEDKLFYQIISASLVIPKDFDQTRKVNFKQAPDDMYGMAVKEHVNQYLSQVDAYEKVGFDTNEAINFTNKDLAKQVDVKIKSKIDIAGEDDSVFYFNFINYLILAQVLLIVSTIVSVYKKKSLAMRNAVSPMPRARMNLELILGHISTGLIVWALYILLFVILYKYDFSAAHINLMVVNSLIFTISVVTMAVFISSLISNENTISGVMQVVSLGSSFLCGAFVPQALLSKTALTLGKIFPSYYYIKNNEMVLENPSLSTILPNIGIMLAFSLVFILISMGMKTKVNDKIL